MRGWKSLHQKSVMTDTKQESPQRRGEERNFNADGERTKHKNAAQA